MLVDKAEQRGVGSEEFTKDDIQILEALRDFFGAPDTNKVANEAFEAINHLRKQGNLNTEERETLELLVSAFVGALMAGALRGTFDQFFSQIAPHSGHHRFDMALRGLHEFRRR